MSSDMVICKVIIRNGSEKLCSIIGEIEKEQLELPKNEWFVVRNVIFKDNSYMCNDMIIYKADIEQVLLFTPNKSLTFDKVDFRLCESLQF